MRESSGLPRNLLHADKTKEEAQKEREDFRQRNETFDQERDALLKKATNEAQAERERLVEAARKEADMMSAKRHEEFQAKQQSLRDEITRRTQSEVFAVTRKTLKDLAGVKLEEQMSEIFVQRLRSLSGEVKSELTASIQTAKEPSRDTKRF